MNDAKRRQRKAGSTPPPSKARGDARPTAASGAAAPADQWSLRSLLWLSGVAFGLQLAAALLSARLAPKVGFTGQLDSPLFMLLSFILAEPIARRISGAARPLRFLESLSVGAATVFIYVIAQAVTLVVILTVRHGDAGDPNHPIWLVLVLSWVVLGFACGPYAYLHVPRRLFRSRGRVRG